MKPSSESSKSHGFQLLPVWRTGRSQGAGGEFAGLAFGVLAVGEFGQFGAQLLGAVVIWTVIFGIAFTFFKLQDTISKKMGKGGIRSKEEDEIGGLDLPEMGVQAYPEFSTK